jgi:hypothetical protein
MKAWYATKSNAFATSTATPSFGTPKKNSQILFVSDFHQLNKWIIYWPYPMPSIHKLFKCFERFTYCTALDLNMGFWTILLDKFSQRLYARSSYLGKNTVTFVFQWDLPVHWTYTKRRCQNCSLTWPLSLVIKMTSLYLPLVHLTTTYDNSAMSSNDSITTTFKSTPRNQASVHWRLNT